MTAFSLLRLLTTTREQQRRRLPTKRARALLCGLLLVALGQLAGSRCLAAEDVSPWVKPLMWTNPASSNAETSPPPLPKVKSRWLKPLRLRADTKVVPRTDEYTANEPDFEQVSRPFHWANPQEAAVESKPQNEAEQIEFEKQHFAWIRPFYWDNTEEAEMMVPYQREYTGIDGQQLSSVWMKPFSWRNDAPSWRPNQNLAQSGNAAWLVAGSTELYRLPPVEGVDARFAGAASHPRTVAFMFQENTLPGPSKEENGAKSESAPPDDRASEPLAAPAGHPAVDSDAEDLGDRLPFEELDENVPLDGEALGTGEGVIADAETLGSEPEDNYSLQFLRADTVLLEPGEMQFDYGVTYTLADVIIPVVNSSLFVEDARFRQRELLMPLEIRYGFTRRLQLFANVPFGWSNIEFTFSELELFENDGGIGDVTFGGTLLLREGDQCNSDLVWTFSTTAPTGVDPFGVPAGQPGVPSLGNGVWSMASNLLWIRSYDPVVVFYGVGTRQSFTREIAGQSFRPGQEYNYQMGVGFAVNSKITFSTRFNGAYITEPRLDGARFIGTIREPMTISFAVTMARCNGLVEPFVDFGLTDESIESRFGVVWTRF